MTNGTWACGLALRARSSANYMNKRPNETRCDHELGTIHAIVEVSHHAYQTIIVHINEVRKKAQPIPPVEDAVYHRHTFKLHINQAFA